MNGVVVKSVDEGAVRRAMDACGALLLAAHPEVEEIVVFGSFADGAWAPGSDLDVFIVMSHSVTSVRDRIPDLLPGPFPVGSTSSRTRGRRSLHACRLGSSTPLRGAVDAMAASDHAHGPVMG